MERDSTMRRTLVASITVKDVGYEALSRRLQVGFHSGRVYEYADVPSEVFYAFMDAASKGRFLHLRIRGRYRHQRIG